MTTFSDDFNRADGGPGANWTLVSGTWTIVSNQLSSGNAGGTVILRATGAMATNDNSAQVTIAATAAVSHGVWCRGNSNISQGYLWRNDGTSWNLFSVVGGSFVSIGSFAGAAVAGDVAKVQAVGSTIKGFVNGVQRVSVTDTAVTTGTSVGVRAESTNSLRFDNFIGADVSTGQTLALGTATETGTAQALARSKTKALGVATHVATAQGLVRSKTTVLGRTTEQDAAQPLARTKTATLGPTTQRGAAQTLTRTKVAALTPAVDQETARALVGKKVMALGTATGTETARPLSGARTVAVTGAVAACAAQPLSGTKILSLAPAVEVVTARRLVPPYKLVPAVETSTAQALVVVGKLPQSADSLVAVTSGPVLAASTAGPSFTATAPGPDLIASSTTGGS